MADLQKPYLASRFQKGLSILKNEGFSSFLKIFIRWLSHYGALGVSLARSLPLYWRPRRQTFVPYTPQELQTTEMVSIIIPFRDGVAVLETCVTSILQKTTYSQYQIVLVDNQSREEATKKYLAEIVRNPRVTLITYNDVFNYSAIHNVVVAQVATEYVLFLNNDTEVIDGSWLTELMKVAQDPQVGAVGPLLLYPDGTIQNAGMAIVRSAEMSFQPYAGRRLNGKEHPRVRSVCEYSAICGACMLTKKSLYQKVGGFDAVNMPIGWSDVDYCLKLRASGLKVVYTSHAQLYHYESYSRGNDLVDPIKRARADKEHAYFISKWGSTYLTDPFFDLRELL